MPKTERKYRAKPILNSRFTYNQILLTIFLILLFIIMFQICYFYITPNHHKYKFKNYEFIKNNTLIKNDEISSYRSDSEYWIQGKKLLDNVKTSHNTKLSDYCKSLSDWDRIRDLSCHTEWINVLRYGKIIQVDNLLGFEKGKRNAFRVIFEDGTRGWYKTCPGEGENPDMEVVGYLMDHLLQFNTMAPAVSRELNIKEIEDILKANGKSEYLELIAQTDYICSSGGNFPGVMIGWWDNLVEVSSPIKKKDADHDEVVAVRENWNNLTTDLSYPIKELPRNHVLLYLLNILQSPGHNEFRVKNSHLVSIDVDRAIFLDAKTTHIGIRYFCKIDKDTLTTINHFSDNSNPGNYLGRLIVNALDIFEPNIEFKLKYIQVLRERIIFLNTIFDKCIDYYGYDDVVFSINDNE